MVLHWVLKTLTQRMLTEENTLIVELREKHEVMKDQRRLNKVMAQNMIIMEDRPDAKKVWDIPSSTSDTPIVIDNDTTQQIV